MKLKTRNVGEIDIDEKKIITFKEGIFGFSAYTRYIFVEDEDKESPFIYMQSIDDGDICFILANPGAFAQGYNPKINEEYFQKLGGGDNSDFVLLVITNLSNSDNEATVNLLAPILIQKNTRLGLQLILESTQYTVRHRIIDLLEEGGN